MVDFRDDEQGDDTGQGALFLDRLAAVTQSASQRVSAILGTDDWVIVSPPFDNLIDAEDLDKREAS